MKPLIATLVPGLVLCLSSIASAQPVQAYQPVPPIRSGIAFEAALGVGVLGLDGNSETALAGLSLGLGGYLNPRTAITARAAGGTYVADGGQISQVFFGPSIQYFVTPNAFVGGGAGLGIARISFDGGGSDSVTDLGIDLRGGFMVNPQSKHAFHVSTEFTAGFHEGETLYVLGLLAGYQLQ